MAINRRIHAPLLVPTDAIPHLGAPHHWKEGRSAKSLVDQWWSANAIPESIMTMLRQAPEWEDAELIDAFIERGTDLADGRPSHSQSDLLAVLGMADRIGVLAIEAKVDEEFDKTVDEWRKGSGLGKATRLEKLCSLLGFRSDAVGDLRYQLFHRTASAIIEAKRYRARQAAMIVQSWSPLHVGFADFCDFFAVMGLAGLQRGQISDVVTIDGVL